MTIRKLVIELAKREGKKSQARIGNIREILGHLSDIISYECFYHDWDTVDNLIKNGESRDNLIKNRGRRAKKKGKK